jgi:hypothetical protein
VQPLAIYRIDRLFLTEFWAAIILTTTFIFFAEKLKASFFFFGDQF